LSDIQADEIIITNPPAASIVSKPYRIQPMTISPPN
jgi:hypothetical protein